TLFTYNGPTSSIDRWKLASVRDRAGNVTSFSYDNVNQVTTVAHATQYYIHRAYDFNGNLLSISLPTTQSDPTQVPGVLQTVNVYLDPGWIASGQVGTNPPIHYDYNGKGQQTCRRPSSACSPTDTSNEVFWNYLPNGKLASRTDQQGQPVSYSYDPNGNLVASHDASGLTEA